MKLRRAVPRALGQLCRHGLRCWGVDVAALVCCFVAWSIAWQQVQDLRWPCETDFYRDLGAAQSILDGQGHVDPGYLGERWWYNPLVPAMVALASTLTRMPLHQVYTTIGSHLNLLAPVAFFAMVAQLFNRRIALASLVGFLFLGPLELMSWLHATYSPWLWPCNFAQGLFYLAIVLLISAFRTKRVLPAVLAGLAAGLTALAHTAPALILALITAGQAARELATWRRNSKLVRRICMQLGIVGIVAIATSAPFWFDIVVRYRLHVVNPAPLQWVAGELTTEHWPDLFRRLLSVRGVVAAAGLVQLLLGTKRYSQDSKHALAMWGGAALAGLSYGFAAQRIQLPPMLPSWHFHFYLQSLESVLFGVGLVALAALLCRLVIYARTDLVALRPRLERGAFALSLMGLVVAVGLRCNEYKNRPDLSVNRRDSLAYANASTTELYEWVLTQARPTDVFLADPWVSFRAVVAAGRKTVDLPPLFSNPYVKLEERSRAASTMYDHVEQARWEMLVAAARPYKVRYVVLPSARRSSIKRNSILCRIFSSQDAEQGNDLYEIVDPGPTLAQPSPERN